MATIDIDTESFPIGPWIVHNLSVQYWPFEISLKIGYIGKTKDHNLVLSFFRKMTELINQYERGELPTQKLLALAVLMEDKKDAIAPLIDKCLEEFS